MKMFNDPRTTKFDIIASLWFDDRVSQKILRRETLVYVVDWVLGFGVATVSSEQAPYARGYTGGPARVPA